MVPFSIVKWSPFHLTKTTEDVIEVHHHNGNHNHNAFDNLRLMHGHCHDIVHGTRYL